MHPTTSAFAAKKHIYIILIIIIIFIEIYLGSRFSVRFSHLLLRLSLEGMSLLLCCCYSLQRMQIFSFIRSNSMRNIHKTDDLLFHNLQDFRSFPFASFGFGKNGVSEKETFFYSILFIPLAHRYTISHTASATHYTPCHPSGELNVFCSLASTH